MMFIIIAEYLKNPQSFHECTNNLDAKLYISCNPDYILYTVYTITSYTVYCEFNIIYNKDICSILGPNGINILDATRNILRIY